MSEEQKAAEQEPTQQVPQCGHEGCTNPSNVRGAPYGDRCQEHIPHVDATYRVQTLEAVIVTCGQCGTNHRVEHPQAIGLAKFKKPLNGMMCRPCGHMLDAKAEGLIITDGGPVARMGQVLDRVGRGRRAT